ncbi:MAG: CoA transferase [Betaproteobacteria bacterium]|nr:CoA transferase [Betaproteobacteria bacterium]
MKGPLAGFRILEIGHMLAGPYCGMLLADLGAEVIKIETGEGDIARRMGRHYVGGHNVYFASLNRNKLSVTLDLAGAGGRAAFHALVASAHGLITNLRPRAIKKLGLTYDDLKACNPKLVCVALTGYGLEGPYAERPAYDYVIQAMTGIMEMTGDPDAEPTKTGYSAVDNSAGIMAALGLVAKLAEGKGGQVDVAMHDVMLSQLNYVAAAWLNAGERPQRYARSAHPFIVPAQVFPTREGWLMLFITHDEFWKSFCEEAGCLDWVRDERFATVEGRRENRVLVIEELTVLLKTDTAANWVARLVPRGIVAAAVDTLDNALASDLTGSRGMVVTLDGSGLRVVGNPIKTPGSEPEYSAPPRPGEHNGRILRKCFG